MARTSASGVRASEPMTVAAKELGGAASRFLAPAPAGPSVGDHLCNDDLHAARRLAVNEYCAASVRGDEAAVAGLLSELVQIELWSGNWQRAGALASRCSRAAASVAARTTGAEARYAGDAARAAQCQVSAARGRHDEVRAALGQRPDTPAAQPGDDAAASPR